MTHYMCGTRFIIEAGFEASQLKDTFTPADLTSNYTEEEIVSAGYSVAELADACASFNAATLVIVITTLHRKI